MELIKKQFNNQEISFEADLNGLVNLTQMAKATDSRLDNYMRLDKTKSYIETLERSLQSEGTVIETRTGGIEGGGTWAHKLLAIHFAQWISDEFYVWCNMNILDVLEPKKPKDNLVADFAEDRLKLAKMFGLEGNQALLSVNRTLIQEKNYDAIKALGIELISDVKAKTYTPTELGSRINLKAVQFNQLLEKKGLQVKRVHGKHTEWEPTEFGKPYCEVSDVGKKHSTGSPVKQIKWYESVLDVVK